MSIIITGLEMPTERESFNLTIKYNGTVLDTDTGMQVAEAHELPAHGRLVDADALMKMCGMERDCYACQNGAHGYCTLSQDAANICEAIDDAPTIIPAEEGE